MHPRIALPLPIASAILFGFLALALCWATGGLSPSLIHPDEGAHYVNALFVGDWIRAGFPNPLAFAQEYYAHFPRLSIGHWPPGWYLAEAPLFALFRPSPAGALAISAFAAGLPAFVIVWALARIGHPMMGLALGGLYLLLPLSMENARYLLLDQPVALAVALAAIAWMRVMESPTITRMLVFALFAAAAPLVKGNGALVALIPAIDIALNQRWPLLKRRALWVAAAVAILLVAPWYWISMKVSAGGFVYQPGLGYAWMALWANLRALWDNLGMALVLAAVGAAPAFREHAGAAEQRIARLALSVIGATLLFQSAVPAAVEPRYIAPMLPWAVILAGMGLSALWRMGTGATVTAGLLCVLGVLPTVAGLTRLDAKTDIGAPAIAGAMVRTGGLWMVDGRAGGEGALIAAAAHADGGARKLWVVRASQWLSASDFLGRDYRLTAATPMEARTVLDRIGAAGVASVYERDQYAYPHSRVLRGAAGPGFARAQPRFARGSGSVLVAARTAPVVPNLPLIEQNMGSANAAKMREALGR
ncbi:glycosyltransferase family 39 protein [Sphingomonas canadensis]|uniref:Glycosyltransferase family 39 protein n=1 Tax=Sphingomonas canadensis TaxID=1219257 RepID=A0ABW3H6Z1_9SPHN|nr:glycosyltransferase family 39 protein [Sphingomonas canadensis]MCW3836807.1 glycosyltransferase family 39 protein [Sphingomonas canadensis]